MFIVLITLLSREMFRVPITLLSRVMFIVSIDDIVIIDAFVPVVPGTNIITINTNDI